MRKLTTVLFGTLTAASLAVASAACAQPADGPRAGMGGPKQPTTRAEAVQRADEAFARLDANGDGFLDPEDRKERGKEHFAKLDADGNGSLSAEEFANRPDRPRGEKGERAEKGERPGKGERMGRKGKRGMERGMGGRGGPGMMGKMADANEDGKISAAEFKTAALARFDRADADGNGTISAAEREQARAAHKAERAERKAAR